MKSKTKAIATIPTTYQITGSGVLEGDALDRVGDPHALVDRLLQRLVDLLPPDHLERVGMASEQGAHRFVVQRVALRLQRLDVGHLGAHLARPADGRDGAGDVL